jgi:hypothetical protein
VTEDEFWTALEDCRRDAGGDLGLLVQLLRRRLLVVPQDVLVGFRNRWEDVEARVFTWPIWDGACLLFGWVSDDFFGDVRAWIISHGRVAVERIIADPDSLVELAEDRVAVERGDGEDLNMLVMNVWNERFGGYDMPPSGRAAYDATSERIDLKDQQAVRSRFPRLDNLRRASESR